MFYSQQGEDRFLYERFLNYRNGTFIELGAMDGVTFSNSLFFENELNWSGILIEPTGLFHRLKENRPNCALYNCAISVIEGEVEFLGEGAIGGITSVMPDQHRYGWHLDSHGSVYTVPSRPLHGILKEHKIDRVDFFSLDVEGGELEVLQTYDWSIPIHVLLIEMSAYSMERDEMCRAILRQHNLIFDSVIGNNEVWVNQSARSKETL